MADAFCAACGATNPPGSRFCGNCGTPQPLACAECGASLSGDQRFCTTCGTPVAGLAPQSGPATPQVAERRVCSVLFADLVGFTPLSETRDPEDVRELLSSYFERTRSIIERYGGVVEKFIGDAVMAVWGAPVAVEGDAERAVRAGLDVLDAVAALGEERNVDGLRARAGVVTGEVAITVGMVGEGMAGDSINTAARVQTAAEPGRLLVDETTYRLARAAVEFADAGLHTLKGKAEPMHLWSALRVMSGVGGAQRVDGLEAPLVGRDAELRTIKELFHASADRRSARLVVVSGPAGVGKSRLGWEFEKYIDGLVTPVWWHRGRCLSYGEGIAFWALAEVVRQRLGIAEEDPTDVAAQKLAAGLHAHISDAETAAYVGMCIGRLLGVPVAEDSGTPLSREDLFAGWRLFFEHLAATSPLVVLIEDAHHADNGLLEFLDYVVDWARDIPIFMLVFARSELAQVRPGWGIGPNRTVLALDPLDTVSVDELVDALVPDMPPAARAAITRQTQGIPLFAVETIRTLIDRDIVVPVEGVYRLVGEVGELDVPDSLRGLLAARLDALPADLRSLVSDAAVLGTTFAVEALAAVSGRAIDGVRSAVEELQRRQIVAVSADRLSPQRGSYSFTHAMLKQVAYETLSRRDRKRRHLTVAAHLRNAFAGDGDEVIDAIARHYRDALDAVPADDDAEDIRAKAVAAYVRAAERATRSGAPRNASSNFAAAADLSEHDDAGTAGRLHERAAEAAALANDLDTATAQAQLAIDRYLSHGDERGAARARAIAGRAYVDARRHEEARTFLVPALNVLEAEPDADTVTALRWLALCELFSSGERAKELTGRALVLGQALGVEQSLLAELFTDHAMMLMMTGRPAEGIAHFRHGAYLAERADVGVAIARAYGNLSDALLTSDPAAALEAARRSIDYNRRVGSRARLGVAMSNAAAAMLWLGQWDEADAELSAALADEALADNVDVLVIALFLGGLRGTVTEPTAVLGSITNDAQSTAYDLVALALITAATPDQPQLVLERSLEALAAAESLGVYSETTAWAWPLAARAAYEAGDDEAVGRLLAFLDRFPPGLVPPLLHAERRLVAARSARPSSAEEIDAAFEPAITALRRWVSPYHLAHGLLDHAQRLIAVGAADAAEPLVAEARAIADRLGSAPLSQRVGAIAQHTAHAAEMPAEVPL